MNVFAASRKQWEELLAHAPPASASPRLLFLDHGAAEVAKSSIGLFSLLERFDFCRILSLEDASTIHPSLLPSAPSLSVYIATSSMLIQSHASTLRVLLSLSSAAQSRGASIDHLTILSSHSEYSHACLEGVSSVLGAEAYSDYAEHLHEELVKATRASSSSSSSVIRAKVTIKHFPLIACPILPWAFVTPLPVAQEDEPAPLPLAHSLGSLAIQLGATSLNIFHLSPTTTTGHPSTTATPYGAMAVAHELSSLPLPFPSTSPSMASPLSIVLVDRACDLASPCSKGGALLPYSSYLAPPPAIATEAPSQPQPHPLDVAVAAAPPLFPPYSPSSFSSFPPSSFIPDHPLICPDPDPRSTCHASWSQRLDQVLSRRPKDVLPLLRKWLKEGLRQEGLQPSQRSKAGSVTPDEIQGLISDLRGEGVGGGGGEQRVMMSALFTHSSLLSLSAHLAGSVSSLSSSPLSSSRPSSLLAGRWTAACALERQILTLMIQSGDIPGLHSTLLDAFDQARSNKGPLLVTDVIQILPLVYSLWPDVVPPGGGGGGGGGGGESSDQGPFSLLQEAEIVKGASQAIVAHLSTLLSHKNLANEGKAASSRLRALAHLDFIPHPLLSLLLIMGRGGKEGKSAASKDIQRMLKGFLAKLRLAASLRIRLADDEIRRLTFHSSCPRDLFSDPPPLSINPLLVTLFSRVTKGLPIADLHRITEDGVGGGGAKGGVDLRGGVSGALMAGTGMIAKGIAGTLGAFLSSASSASQQYKQGGEEGEGEGGQGGMIARGSRVVIFVVGGVSVPELRRIAMEMISLQQLAGAEGGGVVDVMLGSTCLLASPRDICSPLMTSPPGQAAAAALAKLV